MGGKDWQSKGTKTHPCKWLLQGTCGWTVRLRTASKVKCYQHLVYAACFGVYVTVVAARRCKELQQFFASRCQSLASWLPFAISCPSWQKGVSKGIESWKYDLSHLQHQPPNNSICCSDFSNVSMLELFQRVYHFDPPIILNLGYHPILTIECS